jgi:hypothetical protein
MNPSASVANALTDEERVALWRAEELERVGYSPGAASALAVCRDVDLHLALDLVKKGCSYATALRILL